MSDKKIEDMLKNMTIEVDEIKDITKSLTFWVFSNVATYKQ